MYRLLIIFVLAVFLSAGCGKKNDSTVTPKDVKPKDNTTQNQQQTQQTQQNTGKGDAVDFSWTEDGKKTSVSDHKGKVILVNFWATWCGPCRHELPALSEISKELKNKDFKLVGVSVDDNQQVLDAFMKNAKVSYPVVLGPDGLVGKYMSIMGQSQNVIPQTYLIDKNGKVVEAIIGARSKADFLSIINKYL
jgi:thiol-disulfide isomerase/thioredoxin